MLDFELSSSINFRLFADRLVAERALEGAFRPTRCVAVKADL
jgi:hypothetical protein